MAGIMTFVSTAKISELPVAPAANAADQLETNQSGTSRSITVGQIGAALGAAGVGNAGGDLAGTYPNPTLANSVKSFGAVGDGVHDDTAAIQAALNTGRAIFLPKGNYLVTNMLSIPYGGGLAGETKQFSKIIVPATFNLAALGVLRIAIEDGSHTNNEQAGTIRDIAIEFAQPDTAVRASLVQYPPAIYAVSSGRFVIQNIRIVRGWTGLHMPGNSGGVIVDSFEASCFSKAVYMDDIFDVVHISRMHLWPFGLTTNQSTIFKDGNTSGIEAGRVDTLHVTDFFAINMPKGLWLHTGTGVGGLSFGQLENIVLDDSGLVIGNGEWNVSNLYMTPGPVTARTLIVAADSALATTVAVASLSLRVIGPNASGTVETIYVGSTAGQSFLNIAGMNGSSAGLDRTMIAVDKPGGPASELVITGGLFRRDQTGNMANPTIHVRNGARAFLSNIVALDKVSGTGDLLKVDLDNWVHVRNVVPLGWGVTLPANARLINHDTYTFRQTYTPTVSAQTGTITTAAATGRYTWDGRYLKLQVAITITTNGTGAGAVTFTLPPGFAAATGTSIPGRESAVNGKALLGWIAGAGSTGVSVFNYDNTYPGANGVTLNISGDIEVQ